MFDGANTTITSGSEQLHYDEIHTICQKLLKKKKRHRECEHEQFRHLVDAGRNFFWVCRKCGKWENGNTDMSKIRRIDN